MLSSLQVIHYLSKVVKLSGGLVGPVTGTEPIFGVAPFACAANAASCEIAVAGQIQITTDSAVTAGDYVIAGSTTPTYAKDSGQTTTQAICTTVQIGGRAMATASGGSLVLVQLLSIGMAGSQVCTGSLPTAQVTRQFGFMFGADDGAALTTSDLAQNSIWTNLGTTLTIQSLWCQTDTGSQVLVIKDGSTSITSNTITCSSTVTTSTTDGSAGYLTVFSAPTINQFDIINASGTANGTTHRIVLFVKYTVN